MKKNFAHFEKLCAATFNKRQNSAMGTTLMPDKELKNFKFVQKLEICHVFILQF